MDHLFDAQGVQRAILVGVAQHGISTREAQESLDELAHLTNTATFEEAGRARHWCSYFRSQFTHSRYFCSACTHTYRTNSS